jgi:aerobic-type carbon monoxide dehydrogenase small subunit (CoxS/CutS family)
VPFLTDVALVGYAELFGIENVPEQQTGLVFIQQMFLEISVKNSKYCQIGVVILFTLKKPF